jgi:hypothetical protein
VVTARSSRTRWRDDVLTGGSVVVGQRQGGADEFAGATGRTLGKAVRGGAHPSGGTAWNRWRMLRAQHLSVGRELRWLVPMEA